MLLAAVSWAPAFADAPSGEKAARQAVLDFIGFYKKCDLDGAMRASSVPWLYDFTVTYKTEAELKDQLRLCLRPFRNTEQFTDKITGVHTYPEFREKIRKYHASWLDDLLTKDDYVVAVQKRNEPKFNIFIFVRMKSGKATVAGYAGG
jgi:hypothetical protein